MRFRPLFYLLSGIFISVSIYSILVNKFKIGIDFTGGATWEINTTLSDQKLKSTFENEPQDNRELRQLKFLMNVPEMA